MADRASLASAATSPASLLYFNGNSFGPSQPQGYAVGAAPGAVPIISSVGLGHRTMFRAFADQGSHFPSSRLSRTPSIPAQSNVVPYPKKRPSHDAYPPGTREAPHAFNPLGLTPQAFSPAPGGGVHESKSFGTGGLPTDFGMPEGWNWSSSSAKFAGQFFQSQSDFALDSYIYDYLSRRGLTSTASRFAQECGLEQYRQPDPKASSNPFGLLYEWWSIFWEIYLARSGKYCNPMVTGYLEEVKAFSSPSAGPVCAQPQGTPLARSLACSSSYSGSSQLSSFEANRPENYSTPGTIPSESHSCSSANHSVGRSFPPPHPDSFSISQRHPHRVAPNGSQPCSPAPPSSGHAGEHQSPVAMSPHLSRLRATASRPAANLNPLTSPAAQTPAPPSPQANRPPSHKQSTQSPQDKLPPPLNPPRTAAQQRQTGRSPSQPDGPTQAKPQPAKQPRKRSQKASSQLAKQKREEPTPAPAPVPEPPQPAAPMADTHNFQTSGPLMGPPIYPLSSVPSRLQESDREAITRQALLNSGLLGRDLLSLQDDEKAKLSAQLSSLSTLCTSQFARAPAASRAIPQAPNLDPRAVPTHPSFYRDPQQLSVMQQQERQLGIVRAQQFMAQNSASGIPPNDQVPAAQPGKSSYHSVPNQPPQPPLNATSNGRKRPLAAGPNPADRPLPANGPPSQTPGDGSLPHARKRPRPSGPSPTATTVVHASPNQSASDQQCRPESHNRVPSRGGCSTVADSVGQSPSDAVRAGEQALSMGADTSRNSRPPSTAASASAPNGHNGVVGVTSLYQSSLNCLPAKNNVRNPSDSTKEGSPLSHGTTATRGASVGMGGPPSTLNGTTAVPVNSVFSNGYPSSAIQQRGSAAVPAPAGKPFVGSEFLTTAGAAGLRNVSQAPMGQNSHAPSSNSHGVTSASMEGCTVPSPCPQVEDSSYRSHPPANQQAGHVSNTPVGPGQAFSSTMGGGFYDMNLLGDGGPSDPLNGMDLMMTPEYDLNELLKDPALWASAR